MNLSNAPAFLQHNDGTTHRFYQSKDITEADIGRYEVEIMLTDVEGKQNTYTWTINVGRQFAQLPPERFNFEIEEASVQGEVVLLLEESIWPPVDWNYLYENMTLEISDSDDWDFSWEITRITEDRIYILLDIRHPDIFYMEEVNNEIRVTFHNSDDLWEQNYLQSITEKP